MGLIDRLQKAGGIVKNRLASATGALRGLAARIPAPIRRFARIGRLATPVGIGLAVAPFVPRILRAFRPVRQAVTRGVAFIGGQRVVTAAGAGGVVGILSGRREGKPADVRVTTTRRPTTTRRKPKPRKPTRRKPARRKRIPAHRHRVISVPVRRRKRKPARRRTHRSPRHRGHKRVSFTTKSGKRVSFLANPKARHR